MIMRLVRRWLKMKRSHQFIVLAWFGAFFTGLCQIYGLRKAGLDEMADASVWGMVSFLASTAILLLIAWVRERQERDEGPPS